MTDRRIFAALDAGAGTVAQIRASVPNVSEEVLIEHLDRLEADGYVRTHESDAQSEEEQSHFAAAPGFSMLGPVMASGMGMYALRLLADEIRTAILRCGALRPISDLYRLAEELGAEQSRVRAKLAGMVREDLLEPDRDGGGLQLTDRARKLLLIAFMTARLEWSAQGRRDRPPANGIPELVASLAPAARLPGGCSGACRLVERYPGEQPARVELRAEAGRIALVRDADHAHRPDVRVSGDTEQWTDALGDPNTDRLLITGEAPLFNAMWRALLY